jgi:hypothetical protein
MFLCFRLKMHGFGSMCRTILLDIQCIHSIMSVLCESDWYGDFNKFCVCLQSPMGTIPEHIPRPDYADHEEGKISENFQ